ncbi:MAG: N-6 DNA methylase [Pseudolysinimonas sp.]|uniref:N-6 DNA methylase n=1 Tax=Pseudolysinimonas sp. TaxID=2680009 RepID=UPI003266FA25
MTRRLLFARAELVAESIESRGIQSTWHSLVATHASRVAETRVTETRALPSLTAILSDLPLRDAAFADDLLDGLTMSEIGVLYEFSLAHVDRGSRKSSGQFFTPDDVAQFLAARAARFPAGVWIDPCCGVGNLSYWLAREQPDPDRFVATSLVLVDRDPLALLIACVLLTVEFERERPIYLAVVGRSRVADALTDELPEYDYAILNPPYVVVPRDDRFASAESRDLYAYFIERMLRAGDRERRGIVAICPQSFTTGAKFTTFRQLLVRRLATMDVYCFDNVPDNVFRGIKFGSQNSNRVNSTRAAVLVGTARVSGDADGEQALPNRHRITPLLRWRSHERAELFERADDFLSPLQPDAERAFPKVGADLVPLHREMVAVEATLADITSREWTAFHLDIPMTPRYFLSAVKRSLDRGHVHRLYFPTSLARDRAYVVLNSSLAYWWWRVYEGGITVSKSTLASLPLPIASARRSLVVEIEKSEHENVVVKQNAGRRNENVKHHWRLLRELNRVVAPEYVEHLMAVHQNSNIAIYSEANNSSSELRSVIRTPADAAISRSS